MEDHEERMYQKFIYPAIYQKPWTDDTQLDMTDITGTDELETDSDTISNSNAEARRRGQFTKMDSVEEPDEGPIEGQQELDLR